MFSHGSPSLEVNYWSRNKMPYVASHLHPVSSSAAAESIIRRLHSEDKATPLPQKGMGTSCRPHSWPNKWSWASDVLATQVPITRLGTGDQDKPQDVQAEIESGGSSLLLWLETAWHQVSLWAEVLHKKITELVITCRYPTLHVFCFFFPLPIAKGQVLSREQNN